jgi:hypothetical protein
MNRGNVIIVINIIIYSFFIACSLEASSSGERPAGWTEEIRLSNMEGDNSPQICLNSSNVHVVWNSEEQSERINYRRSTNGGNTWDLETQIPNVAGVINGANAIAVEGNNIHFVYENGPTIMYVKSENNGETWSIPKSLTSPSADDGHASIAVKGNSVHVVYNSYFYSSEYYQIFYIQSIDKGDSWGDIIPLSPQNEFLKSFADIAVSENHIHVVWEEHDNEIPYNISEVRYARSTNNGENWEEDYALVPGNYSSKRPAITASGSDVHLMWEYDGNIYYKKGSENGILWAQDILLSEENRAGIGGGDLCVFNENIYVTWYDRRDGFVLPEIYFKSSIDNGNSWSSDIRLSYLSTNPEEPGSYEPKIALSRNSIHVIWGVWEHETNNRYVYYMRTLPNIFPTSIQLSNNPTENYFVKINTSISNNGYADAYNINVSCYINDYFFESQTIDLLELNIPKKLIFNWTPSSSGNYNIRIEVDPQNLSYEWDETDNNLSQVVYINAIPTASINADPTELYTSEIVSFDASDSSDDGTLLNYYFDFGDGNASGWKSSPIITHSYSVSGTYTASLTVKDEYNIESENPAQAQIQVLNRPPEIEIDYPTGGLVDGFITISGTSSDPDGEVEIVYVTIDDNTWMAQGTTSWSYDWDTTKYSNGEHSISVKAYDGEDYSDEAYVTVTVDNGGNVAPTVTINHPNEGDIVSGEIEIRGTANDEDGFIQIVELQIGAGDWKEAQGTTNWKLDWDTATYPNGEYIIKVRTRDDLGLYSQEKTIEITVDNGGNNPPTIEIESHSGGEIVDGTVEIKGSASDQDGNVDLVEIKIDDGNWITVTGTISWKYSWDTTLYSNGEHEIYVRSKDDIGDYSHIKSITIIIDNGGNVPPIVDIISPTGGTVSGIVTITGRASDIDGDDTIESVQVKVLEDWEYTEGKVHWSYKWNTTVLDDGNYIFYVRAFDGTDFSMIKSVEVYVDNPHRPILIITSEIPKTVSGKITIKGTASDPDGEITKVEIQIDEGEWTEVQGTADWSYELDTTKLSNGRHIIRIIVYDDEGEFYIETFDITVDNPEGRLWILLAFIIVILTVILGAFIALKKRKSGSEPSSINQVTQTEMQTFRCPGCNNVFESIKSSAKIQCPHCGLSGTIK